MGIRRSYFRPDQQPERRWFWHGHSVGNQEMRKTHNRRQRAYNRELIEQAIQNLLGGQDD